MKNIVTMQFGDQHMMIVKIINGKEYITHHDIIPPGEIAQIDPPVLPSELEITTQLGDGTGEFTTSGVPAPAETIATLSQATMSGICVLPDESRVYLKHAFKSDFYILNDMGQIIKQSQPYPNGVPSYQDNMQASKLCISPNYDFILSAYSFNTLLKHDINGNFLDAVDLPNVLSLAGITVHANGEIYVGDRYANIVSVITPDFQLSRQFSVTLPFSGNATSGIAIGNNFLYIGDYASSTLVKCDLDGQNATVLGGSHSEHTPTLLSPLFEGIQDAQLSPLKNKIYFVTYAPEGNGRFVAFNLQTNTIEQTTQIADLSGYALHVSPYGNAAYMVAITNSVAYIAYKIA